MSYSPPANATEISGVPVNNSAIGDGKVLTYSASEKEIVYGSATAVPGAVGDILISNGSGGIVVGSTPVTINTTTGQITGNITGNVTGTITGNITESQVTNLTTDLAAKSALAGSTSITTLGTVTTGTWNGSVVAGTYGGTGANNGAKTITLGGNLTTSGANALTLTTTGATNVTLPTTGTLATTTNLASYLPLTGGTTTGLVTAQATNLQTTQDLTKGIALANPTAATSSVHVQKSPSIQLIGQAWNGSATNQVEFYIETLPFYTGGTPTASINILYLPPTGSASTVLSVGSTGSLNVPGSLTVTSAIAANGIANFNNSVTFYSGVTFNSSLSAGSIACNSISTSGTINLGGGTFNGNSGGGSGGGTINLDAATVNSGVPTTFAALAATGTIIFNNMPNAGDNVNLNSSNYLFDGGTVSGQSYSDSNSAATALATAINGNYGDTSVSASATDNIVTVTQNTPGSAGNTAVTSSPASAVGSIVFNFINDGDSVTVGNITVTFSGGTTTDNQDSNSYTYSDPYSAATALASHLADNISAAQCTAVDNGSGTLTLTASSPGTAGNLINISTYTGDQTITPFAGGSNDGNDMDDMTFAGFSGGADSYSAVANGPVISSDGTFNFYQTGTPADTSTPAGWTTIKVNGVTSYVPYYQ